VVGGFLVKREYRMSNKEYRIMKFNKVFHYFDIHHSLFDILRFTCWQAGNKMSLSQQHWEAVTSDQ